MNSLGAFLETCFDISNISNYHTVSKSDKTAREQLTAVERSEKSTELFY